MVWIPTAPGPEPRRENGVDLASSVDNLAESTSRRHNPYVSTDIVQQLVRVAAGVDAQGGTRLGANTPDGDGETQVAQAPADENASAASEGAEQ
jgi:hypothetical protein